jgi:hypothetical protein
MYFAAWAIQIPSIMARNRHFRTSAYQFFLPALNRFEYLLNDFRAGAEMLPLEQLVLSKIFGSGRRAAVLARSYNPAHELLIDIGYV